jgi:hypothetical protein
VRVFSDDRAAREAMLADLADTLGAAPIQHIGKLLVLWRPDPAQGEGRARRPPARPAHRQGGELFQERQPPRHGQEGQGLRQRARHRRWADQAHAPAQTSVKKKAAE